MCPAGRTKDSCRPPRWQAAAPPKGAKPGFAPGIRPAPREGRPGRRARAAARPAGAPYFFRTAEPASAEPAPRIALKKSLVLSMTSTSDFLLKLAR